MRKVIGWSIALLVLAVVVYFPSKWFLEWRAKENHIDRVGTYVDSVEPRVAEHAYALARKHRMLQEHERGEISARLRELKTKEGIVFRNPEGDTYGKLLDYTLQCVVWSARRRVEEKTGMERHGHSEKFLAELKEELKPFEDAFEMDRLLNRASWNMAGALWNSVFGTEYSMEMLAKDQAEFEELKGKLDALTTKNGI